MMQEKEQRRILFAAAGLWAVFSIGGSWVLTMWEPGLGQQAEEKTSEGKGGAAIAADGGCGFSDRRSHPAEGNGEPTFGD